MPDKIDIREILKKSLASYQPDAKVEEVGIVTESGDGIVHISGLHKAMSGEMIEFPNNYYGKACSGPR